MGNITIRHAEKSDAAAIQAVYACPNAYAGTLQLPLPSTDKWEARLAATSNHVHRYVAEIEGEIVGELGFEVYEQPRRRHVASFGMGVKDSWQGRGVGSALINAMLELTDKWMNIKRIELTVYTDNHAAIGLYKKFGFVMEGESKDFAFRNGEFVSVYHMARLK
ncbi:GNAT family N-acetyltransferase [Shewanella sp. SW36]|uniref:GNAT family N-acetyltransferase n=1 Tax=Shewanella TaxID=22 RepID=UPI000DE95570|nr:MULTISPECIES: GNAT family N-acetyltransferase [unclassified Shewanella]RBP77523.1 putative acetyltransferase [Shewanella putrefaciens]MCU7974943.1 GNAT family N-acetyltransferase [Shewanella sp. SW36]MCU7987642.1 GNAT family N-acetyltransferase [Shewanella sp. SW24]MCU7990332.1 GNAT family N-acetyltransferase [Shewanella sp. SW1]MCU7999372.1 GNAT family N-acetyltransferase [Shewanella sp. SM95]